MEFFVRCVASSNQGQSLIGHIVFFLNLHLRDVVFEKKVIVSYALINGGHRDDQMNNGNLEYTLLQVNVCFTL